MGFAGRIESCKLSRIGRGHKALRGNCENLRKAFKKRERHNEQRSFRTKPWMVCRTEKISEGFSTFPLIDLITAQKQTDQPLIGRWSHSTRKGRQPIRIIRRKHVHQPTSCSGSESSGKRGLSWLISWRRRMRRSATS